MDRKYISNLILELIETNNRVTLPSIGTFIICHQPSKLIKKKEIILPPSKSIIFNDLIFEKHELLFLSLKQRFNFSDNELNHRLITILNSWKVKIKNGQRIEIGDCGYLYQNKNGKIDFHQDKSFNLSNQSFGLKTIEFFSNETMLKIEENLILNRKKDIQKNEKPIIDFNKYNSILKEEKLDSNTNNLNFKDNSTRFYFDKKILFVAALIPLVFYTYWIPLKTNFISTGQLYVAELNPFKGLFAKHSTYDPIQLTSNSYNHKDNIKIPITKKVFDSKNLNIKPQINKNIDSKLYSKYHLIGGCFSSMKNAKKFIFNNKNRGFHSFVLDKKNNLFRVSIAQFNHKKEASEMLNTLKIKGVSSWILTK